MKILIVHAHPEPQSFCSALKNKAVEYFQNDGHVVEVSDLYQMKFQPVGGKDDFLQLGNPDFFKYQAEQVHSYINKSYDPSLQIEMDKLEAADIVIFNFPLWWFSLPAILKGWVDRVFAMGFVYGNGKGVYQNGVYPQKKAFLTFTTGGPQKAYSDTGFNGDLDQILYPIHHGILYFVGMQVLPPFKAFSPARITQEEREQILEEYVEYLKGIDNFKPLY